MKINFIVPFVELTGGIKVTFMYANELARRGHDVMIYFPFVPYHMSAHGLAYLKKCVKSFAKGILRDNWKVNWFDLHVPYKMVPFIKNPFIRNADATIATAWPTAYDVNNLTQDKGIKIYFVQHYEIWSGDKNKVDGSYRLPMKKIVIAEWLKELMKDDFGDPTSEIVHNGIDFANFYPQRSRVKDDGYISILLLAHPAELKGMQDGIDAITELMEKYPNIRLHMFGTGHMAGLPSNAIFHLNPTIEELRKLYSNSDIYVFPSWLEGWGLTVVEAMACRCSVVGNRVGCLIDIGEHEKTAMLSQPHDVKKLKENIEKLIINPKLRNMIADEGYKIVQKLNWESSYNNFEKILVAEVEKA